MRRPRKGAETAEAKPERGARSTAAAGLRARSQAPLLSSRLAQQKIPRAKACGRTLAACCGRAEAKAGAQCALGCGGTAEAKPDARRVGREAGGSPLCWPGSVVRLQR